MMKTYSRGDAVIRYLDIIATLPMYSMHYFDVKVYTACAMLLRAEWSALNRGMRERERERKRRCPDIVS